MRNPRRRILGGKVNEKPEQRARRYRGDARSATCRKRVIGVTGALTALLTAMQVAATPAPTAPVRHPLAPGSVWDSVFTLAQAGRGDSLAGINDAPPLTGPAFHKTWDGNALSSLFNRMSNDMPSDNPGMLTNL